MQIAYLQRFTFAISQFAISCTFFFRRNWLLGQAEPVETAHRVGNALAR